MADAPHLGAPININGYCLIALIGGSKFGQTYRVANFPNVFAMKELENVQKTKMSDIEVQILSSLKHGNVVSYVESFIHVSLKKLYIVMEYCELGNLTNVLTSGDWRVPNERFIAGVMKELCCGMEFIHRKNLVHGNIKPENIFVQRRGVIKIGDFKLFTFLQPRRNGLLQLGTPGYISPECEQSYQNTFSSDMWAVGRVLFDLSTLGTVRWGPNRLLLFESTDLSNLYAGLLTIDATSRLTAAGAYESLRNIRITRSASLGINNPGPAGGNSIVSTIIISLGLAAFPIGDDEDRVEVRAFRR